MRMRMRTRTRTIRQACKVGEERARGRRMYGMYVHTSRDDLGEYGPREETYGCEERHSLTDLGE